VTLPAARIGDQTAHGGVIVVGFPTVLIGNMPAARVGDNHTCPMTTVMVPHVGGPLVMGAWTVLVGGVPQSRVSDMLICVGPPDTVVMGENTVLIGMAGGAGMGAIMMGLMAGLGSFLSGYPRAVLDPATGNVVTQYNSQVTIQGSPEYQAAVIADLDRFVATPVGQQWLDAYSSTGRNITIRPIPPGDQQDNGGATRVSPDDALIQQNPDGTETRGAGSDTIIDYNPSYTSRYTGEDGNTYESPPHETLGHELIHGLHNANGENRREIPDTQPNGDNQEEARTIGVHGYDGEDISERNMSEDARGAGSARPDHDSVTGSTYQDENGVWHDTTYDATGNVSNDTVIPAPAGGAPNH
jgi:uncharacterized Zn-binding protein involved in type VI secretion